MLRVGRLPDHGYMRAAYILPERTYPSASPGAFGTDPIHGCLAGGIGRCALRRAADYARERQVFNRPIGQNQSIQHPLAESWAQLEAAEVGHEACERAILTDGGMGYAKEYHVERWLREIWIARIAPVSWQLALSFIAEKELDLPKSY